MQTKEPGKRTSAIFVVLLIIVIPLIIFVLILTNTSSQQTSEKMQDSVKVGIGKPDTNQVTTNPDTLIK